MLVDSDRHLQEAGAQTCVASSGSHTRIVAYCALTPASLLTEADQRIVAMRDLPGAVLAALAPAGDGRPT
ncbi:hypothetical protein [Nostocoides sp. HKS02]|uniref:hypothetical protein n=1 Tax=Nostocoides sp. HKS02 TaxID=1813880 RepID=UPI0012B4FB17|nr:hypothetical protein [Tetrasphaera sp. HKS02]QGN59250.1 hypothetical protein GKE56_16655 [Tetrasphaera sp. HKS02]